MWHLSSFAYTSVNRKFYYNPSHFGFTQTAVCDVNGFEIISTEACSQISNFPTLFLLKYNPRQCDLKRNFRCYADCVMLNVHLSLLCMNGASDIRDFLYNFRNFMVPFTIWEMVGTCTSNIHSNTQTHGNVDG